MTTIRDIVSRYMGRGITDWVMTPREMEALIGELEGREVTEYELTDMQTHNIINRLTAENDRLRTALAWAEQEVNRWRLRAADAAGLI